MSRTNWIFKGTISVLASILLAFSLVLIICGVLIINQHELFGNWNMMLRENLEQDAESLGVQVISERVSTKIFMAPVGSYMLWFGIFGVITSFVCYMIWTINVLLWARTKLMFLPMIILNAIMAFILLAFLAGEGGREQEYMQGNAVYAGIEDSFRRFEGIESETVESVTWNSVMSSLKCCGILGYTDFVHHRNWRLSMQKHQRFKNLTTPLMCCKNKATNYTCAMRGKANSQNNWWEVGCVNKLWKFTVHNTFFLVTSAMISVVNLLLVLVCIVGLFVKQRKRKNIVYPMYG